jgi:hypothetical protein
MRKRYCLFAALWVLGSAQFLPAQTPPPPVNLVAQVTTDRHPVVQLSWWLPGPMMQTMFFKISRSIDDSSNFTGLNITTMMGYHDGLVMPGHTYYYYVTTVVVQGSTIIESARSNIAGAKVDAGVDQGIISGTVTDSLTGKPIPLVKIMFFHAARPTAVPIWIPQAWTDTAGHYSAILDTGTYLLQAVPLDMRMSPLPGYLPEWYKDARNPWQATPVRVDAHTSTTINFDLEKPLPPFFATISGTVTDTMGQPLNGATVVITRTIQELFSFAALTGETPGGGNESFDIDGIGNCRGVVWKGQTDSFGKYKATILGGRPYTAMAIAHGFLPEFYNNKQTPMDADIIRLERDTTGIDFSLAPRPSLQNSVSGIVRDSLSVRVASRIVLLPVRSQPGLHLFPRFGSTDSNGAYSLSNIRSGKYFVLALPFSGYAPAFYKAGAYGVIRWQKADTVTVPATGDVTAIDIGVVPIKAGGFAHLAGRVTSGTSAVDAAAGIPLAGVHVVAQNGQGDVVGYGITDEAGMYGIESLPAGQLSVVADHEGYMSSQGTVAIAADGQPVNADFTLQLSTPTSVSSAGPLPVSYALEQNYPNPFNPTTVVSYQLPVASTVRLAVYDLLGREVAVLVNERKEPGNYNVQVNASGLASGVYLYRIQAGNYVKTMKMVVLK